MKPSDIRIGFVPIARPTFDLELAKSMTALTALPITFVFGFLQKYITTGIATAGMK